MSHLAIIGAGSWGTALAVVLAPRYESVRLWVREPDLAERIADSDAHVRHERGWVLVTGNEGVEALGIDGVRGRGGDRHRERQESDADQRDDAGHGDDARVSRPSSLEPNGTSTIAVRRNEDMHRPGHPGRGARTAS